MLLVGSPIGVRGSVHDGAAGQVREGAGHRAGPIGGHEDRCVGNLVQYGEDVQVR
ncbi:hypothetical protein [Tumebacillus permanentifrigoris]|uniref:hypothetical protein n=1 Tax=Tumebacillus permanentifrigoris TaxID=378543 RepID=UPI001473B724|nr:hypothetical protein [Tumebacillus permanentifrigoris]